MKASFYLMFVLFLASAFASPGVLASKIANIDIEKAESLTNSCFEEYLSLTGNGKSDQNITTVYLADFGLGVIVTFSQGRFENLSNAKTRQPYRSFFTCSISKSEKIYQITETRSRPLFEIEAPETMFSYSENTMTMNAFSYVDDELVWLFSSSKAGFGNRAW